VNDLIFYLISLIKIALYS